VVTVDRPSLALAVLCVVGVGSVVPASPGSAAQVHDSASPADTLPVEVDSLASARASRIDSLRERMARLSAAIMRLQVQHGARVQRIESGLRFRLPFDTAPAVLADADGELEAVTRIADLSRRYYPTGSLTVLGTGDRAGPACGTDAERRRARAVMERLRETGGLAPDRVRLADCARASVATPGEREDRDDPGAPAVTIFIEWNGTGGPS